MASGFSAFFAFVYQTTAHGQNALHMSPRATCYATGTDVLDPGREKKCGQSGRLDWSQE